MRRLRTSSHGHASCFDEELPAAGDSTLEPEDRTPAHSEARTVLIVQAMPSLGVRLFLCLLSTPRNRSLAGWDRGLEPDASRASDSPERRPIAAERLQ